MKVYRESKVPEDFESRLKKLEEQVPRDEVRHWIVNWLQISLLWFIIFAILGTIYLWIHVDYVYHETKLFKNYVEQCDCGYSESYQPQWEVQ